MPGFGKQHFSLSISTMVLVEENAGLEQTEIATVPLHFGFQTVAMTSVQSLFHPVFKEHCSHQPKQAKLDT